MGTDIADKKSPISVTFVEVPKVATWSVETSRGVEVQVESTAPEVSEHGHLEFSNGSVFARNEWSFVTREETESIPDELVQVALEAFYEEKREFWTLSIMNNMRRALEVARV